MKKTILILSLLFSISSFAQMVSYTTKNKEIKVDSITFISNIFNYINIDKKNNIFFSGASGIYVLKGNKLSLKETGQYVLKLDKFKNLMGLSRDVFVHYLDNNKYTSLQSAIPLSPIKKILFDIDTNNSLWYFERDKNFVDQGNGQLEDIAVKRSSDNKYFTAKYYESGFVYGVNADRKGNVWILTRYGEPGLSKCNETGVTNYTKLNSGFPSIFPNIFICDYDGNIWLGGSDGVTKFNGTSWLKYTATDSTLVSNKVTCFALDNDNKTIWIGTEDGISKFDGVKWQSFNSKNSNLPVKLINISMSLDKNGNLWFSNDVNGQKPLSVLCKKINNKLVNQSILKSSNCLGVNLSASKEALNYYWSNGDTTQNIIIKKPGDYNVLMYDSLGCPYMTQTLTVSASDFQMSTPSLCMVTNNEKYNKVVWEQLGTLNISKYKIYKQNTQNSQYEFYKNQDAKLQSEYIDSLSNPNSQIDRYKISYLDTCGNESALSTNHSSILLSTSMGLNNNINLSWNAYEGFTAPNYEIWRSVDGVNYSLLTSVANNTFSYVDLNAPTVVFYQIRVSKSGGCNPTKRGGDSFVSSNIKSINLIPLTINVNGDLINKSSISLCLGDSVKLSGNNSGNYVWDNGIVNNLTFKPTTTKTYNVTGTDENGNVKNSSIEIIVNYKPKITVQTSKTTICSGDSLVLTASGAKDFVWNNSVVNGKGFYPQNSTRYFVKATDINGCSDTTSIYINVYTKPQIQVSSSKTVICSEDSLVLTASGSLNYSWNNNVKNGVPFSVTNSSKYSVTGIDAQGCSAIASIDITVRPLPTKPVITSTNSSLSTTTYNGYQWYLNNQPMGSQTNQNLNITSNGTYSVVVNDTYGCKNKSADFVVKSLTLDELKSNNLLVYPNPSTGIFTINSSINSTFNLYDIYGTHIAEYTENTTQIDLSNYANGVYFLKTQQSNKEEVVKLILNK